MKRRLLVTSKIFGFALAATAVGCGTTSTPAKAPAAPVVVAAAPIDPVVAPIEEAPKMIAPTPPPSVVIKPKPTIDPREEQAMYGQGRLDNDPKLIALRGVLTDREHHNVIDTARFRPLCDADGYPLVGNVMQKTEVKGTQPSAFCKTVRERESKSKTGS